MSDARALRLERSAGDAHAAIPLVHGMRAGISLEPAGDMALSRRDALPWRARFISARGLDPDLLFAVRQVHSRTVLVVDGQDPGDLLGREADGMVTARADAVLSITVADCLPIFIADRASGAFGLVHSGWKGTGIAREAIGIMRARFGTRPEDISVAIGPGIGPCCYRVPEERAAVFAGEHGSGSVVRGADGTPRLDLRRANTGLLRGAGVEDVRVVEECTCCGAGFGSFRRQGPQGYTLMLAYLCRA
jgi:polyphenol oxidase